MDGLSNGRTLLIGVPGAVLSVGVRGTSDAVPTGVPTPAGLPAQELISNDVLGSNSKGVGVLSHVTVDSLEHRRPPSVARRWRALWPAPNR
jgi:hypothetical protein